MAFVIDENKRQAYIKRLYFTVNLKDTDAFVPGQMIKIRIIAPFTGKDIAIVNVTTTDGKCLTAFDMAKQMDSQLLEHTQNRHKFCPQLRFQWGYPHHHWYFVIHGDDTPIISNENILHHVVNDENQHPSITIYAFGK